MGRLGRAPRAEVQRAARLMAWVGAVGVAVLAAPDVAAAAPLRTADHVATTRQTATAPCLAKVRACVDLSSQQAWLLNKGQVVDGPVPISSGDEDNPTPVGLFQVQWKDKNHYSTEYDAPMPYSVFFDKVGDAFHEGDLDTESAGCIHLSHDEAVKFFNYLNPGDGVEILG